MTHENGCAVSDIGIGVAVAVAIGGHFDVDSDSDPDSDPEIRSRLLYFRNSAKAAECALRLRHRSTPQAELRVDMRRREFLGGSPLFLCGARFACAQAAPKGPDLREELSASEIEIVNNSVMAKDLDNFFGKGFS